MIQHCHGSSLPFPALEHPPPICVTNVLLEDLPFDGQGHFNASTDSTLQEMDKGIKASRTLGIPHPPGVLGLSPLVHASGTRG